MIFYNAYALDSIQEEKSALQRKGFIEKWKVSVEKYDYQRFLQTKALRDKIPLEIKKVQNSISPYLLSMTPKIPRHIHYIWIGGPLPKNYWIAIMDMYFVARENGYTINIWTDHINNFKKLKNDQGINEFNRFWEFFAEKSKGFKIRNIKELKKIADEELLFPTGFLKELWHWIDLEQIGLKNLAAASDLLRCLILSYYGGIYLDTDIHVMSKLLYSKGKKITNKLTSLNPTYGLLTMFDNNPLLVSHKKHPILLASLLRAVGQYLYYENQHSYDAFPINPNSKYAKIFPYLSDIDRKRRPHAIHPKEADKKVYFTGAISGPVNMRVIIDEIALLIFQKQNKLSLSMIKANHFYPMRSARICTHLIKEQMKNFCDELKLNIVTNNSNPRYKDFLNVVAYAQNISIHDPLKHEKIKTLIKFENTKKEVEYFIEGLRFRQYCKNNSFFITRLGEALYLRYVCDLNWLSTKKIKCVAQ